MRKKRRRRFNKVNIVRFWRLFFLSSIDFLFRKREKKHFTHSPVQRKITVFFVFSFFLLFHFLFFSWFEMWNFLNQTLRAVKKFDVLNSLCVFSSPYLSFCCLSSRASWQLLLLLLFESSFFSLYFFPFFRVLSTLSIRNCELFTFLPRLPQLWTSPSLHTQTHKQKHTAQTYPASTSTLLLRSLSLASVFSPLFSS